MAADDVMRSCQGAMLAKDMGHPCARVLKRMDSPQPLEYRAPVRTFDDIWAQTLRGRHVDFLRLQLRTAGGAEVLRDSFANIIQKRQVSVLAFRIDALWTKDELKQVVAWLDTFDYFSLFQLVCSASSQRHAFSYIGPPTGPTTYLPLSGVDIEKVVNWERMPLPQDVIAFDLRQPDLFKTIQLGDVHCDVDETATDSGCAADSSEEGTCAAGVGVPKLLRSPEPPKELRVLRAEARSLVATWHAAAHGSLPEGYMMRVEPGAWEFRLEHDSLGVAGVQSHKVPGLLPSTEYMISVKAFGAGGESSAVSLRYSTEPEEVVAAASRYNRAANLHCGMGSAEEVVPSGPPPSGFSFFMDAKDADGCQALCDDSRQCVAYQVKEGEACWLYRKRPLADHLRSPRKDVGWWCGVRKA